MLASIGGVDSLEAGSHAALLQHFKARRFHLQPVFHGPSGSYPIRSGSPVVGEEKNINVPSSLQCQAELDLRNLIIHICATVHH